MSPNDILSGIDELESRALTWIDYLSDFWTLASSLFAGADELSLEHDEGAALTAAEQEQEFSETTDSESGEQP